MPVMQMPNVEMLAKEGMKFRNACGSPQCSPARVCIQTGQSTPHNGFTVYQGKSEDLYYFISEEYKYFPLVPTVADFEIDKDAPTIAEVGARFPKVNPDYDPEGYRKDRSTKERLMWGSFEGEPRLDDDEIYS